MFNVDDPEIKSLLAQAAKLNDALAKVAGERKVVTFGDYALTYLEQKLLNPTLRASTKRSFEHHVRNYLIPAFGTQPIDKVSNADFLRWVTEMRMEIGGITRFFNARKALVEIVLAAKNEGLVERMPRFDNPDVPRSVGRALTDREVFSILRNVKSKFFRFYFYTLHKMGCRPREILRWEWSMITWNEPGHSWIEIPARISKTDRTRRIPINPSVSKRLWREFQKGPESIYVFPHRTDPNQPQLSYHGAWRTACEKAGVDAVPYDFRRTFITRRAAENKPMIYVAKALDTSVKMIESTYAKAQVEVMEDIIK